MKLLNMSIATGLVFFIIILSNILNYKTAECEEVDDKYSNLEVVDIMSVYNDEVEKIRLEKAEKELEEIRSEHKHSRDREELISRGSDRGLFTATSYDLTVASCGKKQTHPAYGITASGYSLVGQDRESAMTIATDPKVIPLGTRVYLEFVDEEWKHWNGVYTSRDTGSAIKGKKIDIFFKDSGDSKTDQEVFDFGRRKVKLTILPNE